MAGLTLRTEVLNHDAEGTSAHLDLPRPRSTPPISNRKPPPRSPRTQYTLNHATEHLSRSPVLGGEADHLYTSGLRRIRQQAPAYSAQGFMIPIASPTASVSSTRVNSISLHPSSPSIGSCDDLSRFPSESLHSFSFAHQSEDLIHSRQNILKRSIEFMRDKLGWGSRSPLMASAHARVCGDEDVESIMELLRKADLVSEEKTPMLTGPVTGPANMEGNPFDQSFAAPSDRPPPSEGIVFTTPILSGGDKLSSSPEIDPLFTPPIEAPIHIQSPSPPPVARRPSLKRTFTDTSRLAMQSKLYDAIAQPYIENEPQIPASAIGPRHLIRKSSVHGNPNRYSPPSQAIFTTLAHSPWTILAANDLACLVFGVTQSEVRKIGILEVVKEERREWLANKLSSGENSSSSFPYPHSVHNSPRNTHVPQQGGYGRRAKSDAFYTPAGVDGNGSNHRHSPSRGVILCGDVVPIQKRNGHTGAASLWVKEKRGGLIWVLEEISEDVAWLYPEPSETGFQIKRAEGSLKNIFGDVSLEGQDLVKLIPEIPRDAAGKVDFEQTALIHQLTVSGPSGVRIPCGVEPVAKDSEPLPVLRISCFPHIAGIIVLSASMLRISSTNAVFSAALLGHLKPIGLPITDIIPQFERMLDYLRNEEHINLIDGMVIPEHSFRKANAILSFRDGKDDGLSIISRPGGLIARHSDGSDIYVDLQMRVVMSETRPDSIQEGVDAIPEHSEIVYALWVTYSRHLHVSSVTHNAGADWRPASPIKPPSPGQIERPKVDTIPKPEVSQSTPNVPRLNAQSDHTPPSSDDETAVSRPKLPMARNATAPAAMSKRGKTIMDFNILEDMGEGAYGQVKLARYKKDASQRVVLKYVTKKRILVDTWTRDRRLGTVPLEIHVLDFLRQNGLRHPNIVEMTDFFEDDINYYIEMVPHGLPGMDLFDYIELKANMDEDECRSIFVQVARAIHHLHTKAQVVHRDIKDENVILDGDGNIKLIDFGSAAYIKNGPFDVFVGTIDYAAPEVLQGKSYRGKEQDVWALGVLLYTIFYKENPFYNIDEIMDRELRIPFVTSELSLDLIKLMLDRDVERRPTIEQVLAHPWFEDLPSAEEALGAEMPVRASTVRREGV
ncbi:Pkinase-domain-containing protein [Ascodesmis nigricans]|uniref:non-specific serine/threonine protein kinase n=1 Tax=Ascodesmis nigricans TaxID=341454 RepID=A0A4S2MQX7_9PEZI|nr:Pkinase-domain-containing protein [Ascodesmis nigricans]